MPAIARWKAAGGVPIEDLERERVVLDAAERIAVEFDLAPEPVRAWFALQIELAMAVQRRTAVAAPPLDLEAIRPALLRLGERQIRSLRVLAAAPVAEPDPSALKVLERHLGSAEIARAGAGLTRLLAALRTASRD